MTSRTAVRATTPSTPTSATTPPPAARATTNLWALARGDVHPGPNGEVDTAGDTLDGGPGNDTFRTRDGEVDKITCGDGNDLALLDTVDAITDATAANPNGSCEKVIRKAPKVKESHSEDAQQAPADANRQS